ncbi:transcriptional repressor CTCFL [Aphelenchoides avenae]|nr:transcriptional repressor CTCFL [Aphelenchus avenae]
MTYWGPLGNAYHHVEARVEVANYSEWYGRVTSTASAVLNELYEPKKEEALMAEESSGDDEGAHLPGPSGMSNGKPGVNGIHHATSATFPQAKATANDEGLYVCRDCQKAFNRRDSLAQHGTQPHTFACHMCLFKTTTAKLLKKHQWEHRTDLRPCHKCDFKALTDKALRRHKRKEHGKDAPAPSLKKGPTKNVTPRWELSKEQLAALAETVNAEPAKNGTLRTNVFGRPIVASGTLPTDDQAADQNGTLETPSNESIVSIIRKKQVEPKKKKKKRKPRSDLMCPHCQRTFARPRDLDQHVKRTIHCWCGYFALNQAAWDRHVEKHSGGAEQSQPPPGAGLVDFKQEPQATRHAEKHSGEVEQPPPRSGPVNVYVKQEPQASGSASGVWWF